MRATGLTPREREILGYLTHAKCDKQIANALGIAQDTVKHHCKMIYIKLQVSGRLEAVVKAFREHIIEIEEMS